MNMLVRMTSEIETNMVSVERISEYQNTPQEAPFDMPDQDPPKEWPQYGVVRFENYQTKYREGYFPDSLTPEKENLRGWPFLRKTRTPLRTRGKGIIEID